MRTSKINLLGAEYTLCFSAGVMIACEEKYGSINTALKGLEDERFETIFWLLHQMMLAGYGYCKINHIDAPEVMPYEQLIAVVGVDDLAGVSNHIVRAIQDGQKRNFEVEYKGKHKSKKKTTKSRKEQSEFSISTKD